MVSWYHLALACMLPVTTPFHHQLPEYSSHLPTTFCCHHCRCVRGVSCSESITTMSILHDSLLAAATAAKQHVTVRFRLHPGALQHGCRLLWPRLEVARRLARRRKLAAALHVSPWARWYCC